MTQYVHYPQAGRYSTYANLASFPAVAGNGDLALALDTDILYVYDITTLTWLVLSGPGTVLAVGAIDSTAASANGAVILANSLIMQSASATVPGLVNLATQSFAGNKTFTGAIAASNFSGSHSGTSSGTNTGDVTIGTASGLSLVNQVLSLGLASAGVTGALSGTDWNTFNAKQVAGSYITALTGDVTAAGPGSVAATIATNAVTNAKAAQMAANTIKGNNTGVTANSLDLTVAEVKTLLNLAGTNSGDVTLTAVGATPNANGASLATQAITLQPANASFPGVLLAADWTTFNAKQAAGNYITALTGDATATGPGSVALTLATVNANVGSFGTASQVGTFTVNAKGLITAASNTTIALAASAITSGTLATARGGTNLDTSASTGLAKVTAGTWSVASLVNADVSASAAIALSKLARLAPTVQKFTTGSGTYTTAADALYIRVRMVGGGGGASGSATGATNGGAGGTGGNSTFGTTLLVANGGVGGLGTSQPAGGAGGTASLGTGPIGTALAGGSGTSGASVSTGNATTIFCMGGPGASSPFGGGSGGGTASTAGANAIANSGSGGGGGGSGNTTSGAGGGGGGAGGYVDAIIASPSATYAYAVGAAGAAGAAGTAGFAGGAGGSGYIEVTEFYS